MEDVLPVEAFRALERCRCSSQASSASLGSLSMMDYPLDPHATAALQFLRDRGAPARLLQHATLVYNAAAQLVQSLRALGVSVAAKRVLVGAILHDAGKLVVPNELHGSGSRHECAGRDLLLQAGYAPEIANFCVTHGSWQEPERSMEDLMVALADKLWKGKREEALEMKVLDRLSKLLGREPWDLFQDLDPVFEAISAQGHERILLTQNTV